MSKSEALKGVIICPIEEVVDEAMGYLPGSFDITNPENRLRVRQWMVRVCGVVARNCAENAVKAAESAIQEASALAINPDYYAERNRHREKRKAQRALMQNREMPKSRAEMEFDRLNMAGPKQ